MYNENTDTWCYCFLLPLLIISVILRQLEYIFDNIFSKAQTPLYI